MTWLVVYDKSIEVTVGPRLVERREYGVIILVQDEEAGEAEGKIWADW